jgi:hypothetical protein
MKRRRLLKGAASFFALAVALGACSTGVRNVGDFENVVDHDNNYSCKELIEIADKLERGDRVKAEARLDRIGCDSKTATRVDR